MSSPIAKRRHVRAVISDDEDVSDAVSINKENVQSPSHPLSPKSDSIKQRRSSLIPIDQNSGLILTNTKLEPSITQLSQAPSSQLPPPSSQPSLLQSPVRQKPSFNGPDIITLSPIKNSRTLTQNHYSQDKLKGPVTRLVINKLVLNNFKSYAGTQVIGPFHTSFSAVVGPNGSGKSNVIDSMLFVFGFRANKMRQGKLSELIHNSEAAPNLQSCSVDIHFLHVTDHLDDTTSVVEGSELVISRRAFRNNSSKYYINDKESNYTEVTRLLKEKGIDLDHKRFLILQGEVESIAQMKPKAEKENDDGLLEYLEDIIGTSNFKSTIEDSYKKIEELNEVCQEKENRFGLVEKETNTLEPEKEKALQFILQEKRLVENQSLLYQYQALKSKENIEVNNNVLKELKEKLKAENAESIEFQNEVKVLEKAYNELLTSVEDLDANISKLQTSQKKGEREKVAFEERKKSLESKKKKSEKLLKTAITALHEAESKQKIFEEEDHSFEKELQELKQSLKEEKATLDELRSELSEKTRGFNEQLEVYEKQLQPWKDRLEQKKSEIAIADSEIQMLKDQRSGLYSDIENLKHKIDSITQDAEVNKKTISTLKREQVHVDEQISMGEQEVTQASQKLDEMNSLLSTHRQKTLEARGNLSQVQNKSKVLAALMRLQETGRITGFHGRLGDLGFIDDKYDVAVSTACSQLDDMVVDTVETGQQCIEYLRKNDLGFARFILLTKLRKFNLNPINTPNNVPRLFDLITPRDPIFGPAFYSALQDTLVAANMKEANQVAYGSKRFRVVTLDGKLIDKSGTLSGGGNVVNKGGMKSSAHGTTSPNEVIKLERELSEKESNYEVAQNTFYEMESALNELKDRKPQIEVELSKLNFENDSLNNEINNSRVQLKDLEKAHAIKKNDSKELDVATAKLSRLNEEFAQLNSESQEFQNKIAELQEKVMQVGGVKLRLQKSTVDGINEKIEISNQKINNNSVAAKKLFNELKRYNKSKTINAEEINQYAQELQQVESALEDKVKSFETFQTQLNELSIAREEQITKSEDLKILLDEKQDSINELRSTAIEIENKIERHHSLVKQETNHLNAYFEAIKSLEVRDVSELIDFINDEEEKAKYLKPTFTELSPDELKALDITLIEETVDELDKYVSSCKINLDVLEEYSRRKLEFDTRKNDLNDAVQQRDDIKKVAEELKKKRLDQFMEGFNIISATLKEMYQMITMGGNAELELVDSLDPFSEGILFSVMPPKKSWKNISNLSGGEKTLSSLALVFALHRYKPTPLYVMDEIDAALDFRNVSIIANYIKERTKNAQFVVISLRNNMFELAQQLVGIYKVNNMTRSITLQNTDMLTRD
ncbi:hypothetical protein WICMUC_002753 [Wickerhamomyces mucosus]|uniref:Structural maintenance of chromosomes protein n=1 Tax=Wickerhamomyces mucosus TaxID=1378264 RepID=A0A9P8PQG2_9ASCO|nr:hypothetical protein WICMUC_002753 [Wickerhamomyces mucosus]